jgi:hypothetical protein
MRQMFTSLLFPSATDYDLTGDGLLLLASDARDLTTLIYHGCDAVVSRLRERTKF